MKGIHFVAELTGDVTHVRCMDRSEQGQNPFSLGLWSLFIPYKWAGQIVSVHHPSFYLAPNALNKLQQIHHPKAIIWWPFV